MKKILFVLFAVLLLATAASAAALSGEGTADDPYIIGSVEAFAQFAERVNAGESPVFAKLSADLNFEGHEYTVVGTAAHPFCGLFDGCGKTVTNVSINEVPAAQDSGKEAAVGVFGFAENASFVNLRVENVVIDIDDARKNPIAAGLLCGKLTVSEEAHASLFEKCEAKGRITMNGAGGRRYGGGLCGYAFSRMNGARFAVRRCDASADISAQSNGFLLLGGLCGMADLQAPSAAVTMTESYAAGSLHAGENAVMASVGGLVGNLTAESEWSAPPAAAKLSDALPAIVDCFAACDVSADGETCYLGDLCGYTTTSAAENGYCVSGKKIKNNVHALSGTAASAEALKSADFIENTLGWVVKGYWRFDGGYPAVVFPVIDREVAVYENGVSVFSAHFSDFPACFAVCAFYGADGRLLAGIPQADPDGEVTFEAQTVEKPATASVFLFESERTLKVLCDAYRYDFGGKETLPVRQAYLLCLTDSMDSPRQGIESGWVNDNRAGVLKSALTGNDRLYDYSKVEVSRLIRPLSPTADDVIDAMINLRYMYGFNGVSLTFEEEGGEAVYRLLTRDGGFTVQLPGGESQRLCDATLGRHLVRVMLDTANGSAETMIDGISYGSTPFASAGDITRFVISSSEETENELIVDSVNMVGNYAVYENYSFPARNLETDGNVTVDNLLLLDGEGTARHAFNAMRGNVTLSLVSLLPGSSDGVTYALTCGGKEAVSVGTAGGRFTANGVDLGKAVSDKLWWKIRIEADTEAGTAAVYLNAKKLAEVPFLFDAPYIDGVMTVNASDETVKVDDVRVFYKEDYDVPAPNPLEDGTVVGVNVCSLWKNGEHFGWGLISPYDDHEPVLGYYDEGNPETADWEIKYMADHGIDFQAFCWYANRTNEPMKDSLYGSHLDEGYLFAKNSDAVKFSLIWEAANGNRPASEQDFYDYYVPYLVENYFADPRYVVLDNGGNGLLPFSIFGADRLIWGVKKDDGTVVTPAYGTTLKRMFAYLDNAVKALGYDGVLFAVCNYNGTDFSKYGFAASHAYNWGTDGASYDATVSKNLEAHGKDLYAVPTVSMGYCAHPWNMSGRVEPASVDTFSRALSWAKNTYLTQYAKTDSLAWNDNLIWLSTWNEYGEGTYLMPCEGLNGFGYLDALRSVLGGGAHSDPVPTQAQKARINHAYPQSEKLLAADGFYTVPDEARPELYVNNVKLDSHIKGYVSESGEYYYPFEPLANLLNYHLFVHYDWSYDTKTLTLYRDGKAYAFTVGSDTADVDGESVSLSAAVLEEDRVPMLPMKAVCGLMGFRFVKYGNDYLIVTPEWERVQSSLRVPAGTVGNWTFCYAGKTLGFSEGSARMTATPSYLNITSDTGTDPVVWSPNDLDISCDAYPVIEIAIRGRQNNTGYLNRTGFYFITNESPSYNEQKHVTVPSIPSVDEAGEEFQTVQFDMSANPYWTGTLKQLRFDMFEGGTGYVDVAYIRLLDADGAAMPGYAPLVNPCADNTEETAFTAGGGSVTITTDGDTDDPCFVVSTAAGKQWVYFIQRTAFIPGKTYAIDFDVKVRGIGTAAETAELAEDKNAQIICNFRYRDPSQSGTDHVIHTLPVKKADGWVHYHAEYTVKASSDDRTADAFTAFANPVDEHGVNYLIDNVSVALVS